MTAGECIPTHYNNVPEKFVSDYVNWSAKGSVQSKYFNKLKICSTGLLLVISIVMLLIAGESFSTYSHSRSESALSDPIWSVKEQSMY